MMAAGRAASLGADVRLLEKNQALGRKLLLTGQGRCNLTNNLDSKQFIADCGPKAKFLYGALARFSTQDTVSFFESLGLRLKLERGGRYFPQSDDSHDVLRAMERFLRDKGVKVVTRAETVRVLKTKDRFNIIGQGNSFQSDRLIIATGGKSYPATGSTGDGYRMASSLGHAIVPPRPTDVPLEVREEFAKDLQGLSLKNVRLNFVQSNRKAVFFGEMLFTHYGISGPIVLDASRTVGPWLEKGPVDCRLDLKPALDSEKVDLRLRRDIQAQGKKRFKGLLKGLLPATLVPVFAELCGLGLDAPVSQITAIQRKTIARLLKEMPLTVTGLRGYDEAVATSGGVNTSEVDPKTMESQKTPGLYFCGEVLDLDGPCGGYNLQIAWSTGWAAGTGAGAQLGNRDSEVHSKA
jgi:hypothetical protein